VWLRGAPELRERLRIAEIKEDRRLERGGCLVKAGDNEWDATVERQLAVLGEALQEALSVPAESPEAGDV
jgi:flagellar biosynthesis/type III secretory pathway protein FliH